MTYSLAKKLNWLVSSTRRLPLRTKILCELIYTKVFKPKQLPSSPHRKWHWKQDSQTCVKGTYPFREPSKKTERNITTVGKILSSSFPKPDWHFPNPYASSIFLHTPRLCSFQHGPAGGAFLLQMEQTGTNSWIKGMRSRNGVWVVLCERNIKLKNRMRKAEESKPFTIDNTEKLKRAKGWGRGKPHSMQIIQKRSPAFSLPLMSGWLDNPDFKQI